MNIFHFILYIYVFILILNIYSCFYYSRDLVLHEISTDQLNQFLEFYLSRKYPSRVNSVNYALYTSSTLTIIGVISFRKINYSGYVIENLCISSLLRRNNIGTRFIQILLNSQNITRFLPCLCMIKEYKFSLKMIELISNFFPIEKIGYFDIFPHGKVIYYDKTDKIEFFVNFQYPFKNPIRESLYSIHYTFCKDNKINILKCLFEND